MKAIVASNPGGPDVLTMATKSVPNMQQDEVLIKVYAAGVNGADLKERQGKYPLPPGAPDIMGLEVSGEIVDTGYRCKRFKSGDKVCALLIGGGYAEYAVAPEEQCMPVPENVDIIEAAGIPEVFCTIWANMVDRCALKAGETVLIQGGTSGIGYAGIKLAKAFGKKETREYDPEDEDEDLMKKINEFTYDRCYEVAKKGLSKSERGIALDSVKEELLETF